MELTKEEIMCGILIGSALATGNLLPIPYIKEDMDKPYRSHILRRLDEIKQEAVGSKILYRD